MGEHNDNSQSKPQVIDIGVNLTHEAFKDNWREVVASAIESGVEKMLLTGVTIEESLQSLAMAEQWFEETGCPNLFATVGVHPCYANTWKNDQESTRESLAQMRTLLQHPLAVSAGECGLDYHHLDSTKEDQIQAFREQLILACELQMPLFLHERDAHEDFISILDEIANTHDLPPIVVHCFTGTAEEAAAYVKRGFYLSFAGTICKKARGRHLRELLPNIPLERLMVETDAPYMGFQRKRRGSVPADCVDVARKLGETIGVCFEEARDVTTNNAMNFFRIPSCEETMRILR